MHFHLPKPLHGWREFVGEVAIIVLGVLIALGAEQVVDELHWRHTTDAERKALNEDVADMWNAMSGRVVIERCVDRRLDDLRLVLARHEHGQPLGIFGPIGRPGVWTASTDALQMASADQSLSHMPFKDERAYFGAYGNYPLFERAAFEERDSWRVLQDLDDTRSLDATDWRDIRSAYRNAVDSNNVMKANLMTGTAGQWLTPFEPFQPLPPNKEAMTLWMVKALCRPAVKS